MIVNVSGAVSVKVWKQDRLVAHLANMTSDVKLWTTLHGSAASPIAVYTPDTNKDVYIDLTDYVRTYPTVTGINFSFGAGSNWPMLVSVVGLISPDSVIIPKHVYSYDLQIEPPSMMYHSGSLPLVKWEARNDASHIDYSAEWGSAEDPHVAVVSTPSWEVPLAAQNSAYVHVEGDHGWHRYKFKDQACDNLYAAVRWESFTGATRLHILEVVKAKIDNANNYSLLDLDNQYKEIKGRVDGFTLRIDGLNIYDLWYYADICNSSKVDVCLDGSTWNRVQVTTKSFTIPDGGATDGKLEITLNWKKYDAVAM